MRTITLIAVLLLLVGCGTTVDNWMFISPDFQDSNPGTGGGPYVNTLTPEAVEAIIDRLPSSESLKALAPEDRAAAIDMAIEDAEAAGDLATEKATGPVSTSVPISNPEGMGYQINVFSQSGAASQDVQAQVEAALRANAAWGGGVMNPTEGGTPTPGQ